MPINLVKSEVSCPGSVPLKRYSSPGAPSVQETLCKYAGLGKRFTQGDCCAAVLPDVPGCEQGP